MSTRRRCMFIPLYSKTTYALLSSMMTIKSLVEYGKENHLSHLAICDPAMYGTMEFIGLCEKEGITPVIGLELLLEDGTVLCYAKNYHGYQMLIKLSTIQSERKVTWSDLEKFHEDCLAIVPFSSKRVWETIQNFQMDTYLGYESKKEEEEARGITSNVVFCPMILSSSKEDNQYLKYLWMIRDGKTVADMDDALYPREEDCFYLGHEVLSLSSSEGLINSQKIASKCHLELPKATLRLPVYPCENGMSAKEFLKDLSMKGLWKRLQGTVPEVYQTRLFHELEMIDRMGFSNYFLVVYDFIKYAKKNGILVGPGRGSAAGSLVSFTLGITDIDPIYYDLFFERFLNPERVSMPDIDTDFPDIYRDQVIDYVREKYGSKNVTGIVTFGTLASKQAIRDVSRVLGIPLTKVDLLCNMIPTTSKEKLPDFLEKLPRVKEFVTSDRQLQKMYQIATRIEGFPRHTSIHAAGIVMCDHPLDEIIPLVKNQDGYLTGYSMEYLEPLGLLKMDFLGLKNLTTIMNIIADIKTKTGTVIDFMQIPLDDEGALHLFTVAETSGIFQFESQGMRNFLRKLRPTSFEDIFAAIALFRPGPAINIDTYIRRKHKDEEITYLDNSLKPILENTYGIFIYQEQIMQVARTMAGYTLGEADILRRAMSKKKKEVLEREEERFIEGSIQHGYTKEKAKEVFDLVLNFAGYGFNRSHSVAYAIIAYKMAYLKARYPQFFFSNLLSSVIGSETKTQEYLYEAKGMHLTIIKPNINQSGNAYEVVEDGILFPLSNIRNVGTITCRDMIKARGEEPFTDLHDAISRLVIIGIPRRAVESLIYAGAFDFFGYSRKSMIDNLDNLWNYGLLTKDLDPSLVNKPELIMVEEYDQAFLLAKEKEMFGFYLSSHPSTNYRLKYQDAVMLKEIGDHFNRRISMIILVEHIKTIDTKNNEKMAFLLGSDETATVDFTLFPRTLKRYPDLKKGDMLFITGNVERRMDQLQIIVQNLELLNTKNEIAENNKF